MMRISHWAISGHHTPQRHALVLCLLACGWMAVQWLEYSGIDLAIARLFYQPQNGGWHIEKSDAVLRWIFYHAPKYLLAIFGACLLGMIVFARRLPFTVDIWALGFVVVCLALIPLATASLKSLTDVACPYQLTLFHGTLPYQGLQGGFWPSLGHHPACFPAGHPSGGFALLALAYVTPRKYLAIGFALLCGGVMSGYQMARGAHFASHCLATLLLSIAVTEYAYPLFHNLKHKRRSRQDSLSHACSAR